MAGSSAHLFFGIPCYGGQITEAFFTGFVKFQLAAQQRGLQYSLQTIVNESLITRGRNTLVAHFLANPNATHLMFIDTDIRFEPKDIYRLLEHNKEVIGAAYPKKNINWEQIQAASSQLKAHELRFAGADYALNPVAQKPELTSDGLLEVKDLATGFLMIQRSVIERMCKEYPQLKYKNTIVPDPRYTDLFFALFDTSIDTDGVYLSEDYTFCRRWQKMGGKIYCDPSIALDHIGTYSYSGRSLVK